MLNSKTPSPPVLQLGLESKTLSEQQIFDLGLNFIRTQLATVQGASVPLPFGGKFRQVMVDLNPEALYAKGLSPADVSNALGQQSLILPAGAVCVDSVMVRRPSALAAGARDRRERSGGSRRFEEPG